MRVVVIGAGSIGQRHLRCFGRTGRAEVAVCEIDAALRQRVADQQQISRQFADLEELLASDWPQAAVVCTPAHLHVAMATALADRGLHLLIEKPLSTSLDGIGRLRATAAQRRVCVGVAYVYRAHPALAAMRTALARGDFGQPVEVVAVSGQHFPHYRPAYREIYYARRETGGGAVQDALTHVLNAAQWLVGPMTEAAADAQHCVLEGVEVEDTVHVVGRHAGVMASYSLNQHQAPNETNLTVVCRDGTVRFQMHRHAWQWCRHPETPWEEETFTLQRDDLFVRQAEDFLDSAATGRPTRCTLDEAAQTLSAQLAILDAAAQRQWRRIETVGAEAP